MSREELERIADNIQMHMILEQNTGYRNEYSQTLKDKIDLYNEVIILQERMDEAINNINITISIIKQQPSKDKGLDFYIISKLESFIKTLKGEKE